MSTDARRELFQRELLRAQTEQRDAGRRIEAYLRALDALDDEDAKEGQS